MTKKLIIYTDGGARGNPGPAGIGVVIYDAHKKILKKIGEVIDFTTNNQAEYQALIRALGVAGQLGAEEVECFLDSELVVKQLQGLYKVRDPGLQPLAAKVLAQTAEFSQIKFRHIPREQNKLADQLVNRALDQAGFN